MKKLDDKLVVVTGAAGGIGRATALRFAREGARLAVCDVDQAGLDTLAGALGERAALVRKVDVSDRAQMSGFAADVHALQPAADVVVNNAGVGLSGGILETSLDDWDWVLRINLGGVIHGCHLFAPPMVARAQGGQIVNVSSCLGYYPAPGAIGYVASKYAVLGLSLSMRAELAPHGIGVTAVCPGLIATGIVERGRFAAGEHERGSAVKIFRERGRSPDQVAAAIVDAVKRDRAVRPVAPEAWALWALSRLVPGTAGDLGRRVRSFATRS
jgi:NAD(P)-dependent dehydrogenase (short-subunit alcohol dehydrogenase family)